MLRISASIGVAVALILFTAACNNTLRPTPVPILTSTTAPVPATDTPATLPEPATDTPVPGVPTPGPGTPGAVRAEERETPTPGEELVETAPKPNQLPTLGQGGNPNFQPVAGADITKNGAAATMKGSAAAGQTVYNQNCVVCHGSEGKAGSGNLGSTDGTVPTLNPIDPGFKAGANGGYAAFASELDLFVQHGSRPAGPNPAVSMIPWGDENKITQQQIADVEAYIIQLNGGP
jgi:mono/diheme cytochrome c family protein